MDGDLVDDVVENETDVIEVPEPEMTVIGKEFTTWAAEHGPKVRAISEDMSMSPTAETQGTEI